MYDSGTRINAGAVAEFMFVFVDDTFFVNDIDDGRRLQLLGYMHG
jgi:hypothetical protein